MDEELYSHSLKGEHILKEAVSKDKALEFMKKAKTVFLIQVRNSIDDLVLFLKALSSEESSLNAIFVCFNSSLPYYLEGLNLKFRLGDDYLTGEDYEYVDDFIYKLTRNWYLFEDAALNKLTEYDNVQLGKAVEYDFQSFLIPRVKGLEIMLKVVSQESPRGIILIEDRGIILEAAKLISQNFHLPLLSLEVETKASSSFSLRYGLRSKLIETLSLLVDYFVRMGIILKRGGEGKVIIDKRVFEDLFRYIKPSDYFLPTPFEKGLRIRLHLLRKKFFYFPFYFPSNYATKRKRKEFISRWRQFQEALERLNVFYYKGISLDKLIGPKLKEYFLDVFPRAVKNIRLVEYAAKKELVKAIVLRHDLWELQRTNVEIAKKMKIPTIVLQHGVFGEKGEETIFADSIAVWGKVCVNMYEAFGNDPRKCRITGNPRFDIFANGPPSLSKEEVCQQLGIESSSEIIVLATGIFEHTLSSYLSGDEYEVIIAQLVKMMRQLPDKHLIIKLHPYDNFNFSQRAIRDFMVKNVSVVKDFDLYSLINSCDLLITKHSTVGLKAMVLNKPVIIINLEKRKDILPYVSSGAAFGVYNVSDILPAINKVFNDQKIRIDLESYSKRFVSDYAYRIDGQSSRRALDFISERIYGEF